MSRNEVVRLGNVEEVNKHQSGNVYGVNGSCPTIMGGTHGYGFGYFLEVREVGVVISDTNSLQS